LKLKQGARVLDIACGKGEFLIRLAELYDISGIGVDISPYFIKDSLEKHQKRVPKSNLKFIEMDGAKYKPESSELFDVTMCIGASWIYSGYLGTIKALKKMTKQEGLILIGEPYWIKEPDERYLKAEGIKKEDFLSHYENMKLGEEEGLTCIYTVVSNHDDWDHYETFQWWASNDYARANPDDPDLTEILSLTKKWKEKYLRWGRDTQGWAIYVFRNVIMKK
ncbi:MAG: SAM-dependent methyltransferase, partial [Promethearchaeota archaeon]